MGQPPIRKDQSEEERRKRLEGTCDVIAAVPYTALYSPNYAPGSGGVSIVGKLPPRLFVGVRVAGGDLRPGVRCAETYTLNTDGATRDDWFFEPLDEDPIPPDALAALVEELRLEQPLELVIWSEFPFQRGLNADAAVATATAAALCVFASPERSVAIAELRRVAEARKAEALGAFTDAAEEYRSALGTQVFRLAVQLESAMYSAPADGHFTLASMLDSRLAMAFGREPDPEDGAEAATSWLQSGRWWGAEVQRLWHEGDGRGRWPLALALCFVEVGDTRNPRGALTSASLKPHVDPLEDFLRDERRPLYGLERGAGDGPEDALLRAYRQASVACSVRVLQTLKRLVTEGSKRMGPFCDAQDRCQALLNMLERSFPRAQQTIATIQAAAARESVPVGIRFQEYGRHGYLLIVGPPVRLKELLDSLDPRLSREVHWTFEPKDLPVEGLRVKEGDPERVHLRILRGRTWTVTPRASRSAVERERLHLLLRGQPGTKRWEIAWSRQIDGKPNRAGNSYAALSEALESAAMPNQADLRKLKIENNLLPTLGNILATLSNRRPALQAPLARTPEGYFTIPPDRREDSIQRAGSQADLLLGAMVGRSLGLRTSGGDSGADAPLLVSIDPDEELAIGLELVAGSPER